MVEKSQTTDGTVRNVIYGVYNEKTQKPGYSMEIINPTLAPEYHDEIEKLPLISKQDTMLKLFKHSRDLNPDMDFLGTRQVIGTTVPTQEGKTFPIYGGYNWQSWGQIDEKAYAIAKVSLDKDFVPHQPQADGSNLKIFGIWSKNRYEWLTTQISSWYNNYSVAGFYDTMDDGAVQFIIDQCQMKTIFCEEKYIKRILGLKKAGKIASVKNIVNYDDTANNGDLNAECQQAGVSYDGWTSLIEQGKKIRTYFIDGTTKDDLMFMCYTSGTTGNAKGVMLTHNNLLHDIESFSERMGTLDRSTMMISYLPYPHVFEQCLMAASIRFGGRIGYFSGHPKDLTDDCAQLKPTVFTSVPRLYNKIHAAISAKMEITKQAGGCKAWLLSSAMATKEANLMNNVQYTHCCYDFLIFKKMKAILGGEVQTMITGSAPLDKDIMKFFKICFSCPLLEGYGLSETSAAATCTDAQDPNLGHVGGPIRCTKIRLKDIPDMNYFSTDKPYPRGEIQIRGPNVFKGYFGLPEITKDAFDGEWFNSGDVGRAYENGSISIIDRAKMIMKLSQGEYVAPQKLEGSFGTSPLMGPCFVYATSLKSCTVMIVTLDEGAEQWAVANGKPKDHESISKDPEFKKAVIAEMERICKANAYNSVEKPKDVYISAEGFSVENGCCTPTFKMKRKGVEELFKEQLDAMYAPIDKAIRERDERQ